MQKGFIAPIIIGIVVATIVAVGVMGLFSILPGNVSEKETKPTINEFARMVSNAKPLTDTGFVADPPWDAIKLVEKFAIANGKVEKDAKIDFQLTHHWAEEYHQVDTVTFYVSGNPFRWRADFTYGEAYYKGIVSNNNNDYYSCYSPYNNESYDETCGKVDSLENLAIPGPFTGFLGTALDTYRLKMFLTQIPQASTRTIAGKEADCLRATTGSKSGHDLSVLEICIDKESKLPLYVEAQNNIEQFILEATKLEISPLSADVFTPSGLSLEELKSSSPSDETAKEGLDVPQSWKTFTNKVAGLFLRYPPNSEVFCEGEDIGSPSCLNLEKRHFFFSGEETFSIHRVIDREPNESINKFFDRLTRGETEKGKIISVNGLPAWTENQGIGRKQIYIVNGFQVWLVQMSSEGETDMYAIHKDMLNSLRFSQ